MTTKLKLKLGALEIEFEGSEEFITTGLMPLVEALQKVEVPDLPSPEPATKGGAHKHADATITTSTIAQKLGAASGRDLVLAAIARLLIVKQGEHASRLEILKEMRGAKSYFKRSYNNNLTKTLGALTTSGKFNDLGGDNYSLSAAARQELEQKIAK
jgi:hypothetical protein